MISRRTDAWRLGGALVLIAALALTLAFLRPAAAMAQDFGLIVEDSEKSVSLSVDDLLAYPQKTVQTHTLVTDGVQQFEGPLMRDVLADIGITGDTIEATALNDYLARFPISDIYDYDVIMALKMNGKQMSVRDKGPIWIVYPRDDFRELQDLRYDRRWVWQLNHIYVR